MGGRAIRAAAGGDESADVTATTSTSSSAESGDGASAVGVASDRDRVHRTARVRFALILAAVNAPVVVATTRALARGWQPLGDNGLLLLRARDVGTEHHPLLGSWTSASLLYHEHFNNPGPLYLDLLAPPIRLLGPWVGLAVGVMLVNMAASTLAVVAARRISGVETMAAVAIVVVGLQFAMGSELLFDVWQPNALVLPMMAFLVVAVVVATGDLAMAPWLAGLGMLLVQTHLSHAPVVVLMTAVAVVRAGLVWRGRDGPIPWRRPVAWSAVILVVGWAQPVVEQFTGRGEGNLSRIVGVAVGGRGETPTIGMSQGLSIVSEVTLFNPWFSRSSYDEAVPLSKPGAIPGLAGGVPALLALAAVVAALIGLSVAARRRGEPNLATLAAMSATALVAGVAAVGTSPVNVIGAAVHGMRWIWPIAALTAASVVAAALVGLRSRPPRGRWATTAVIGLALIVALANLPTHAARSGPTMDASDLRGAQQLVDGLDSLEDRGTVLFDPSGLRYAEPYTGLVYAELQDRGIPFVFDDGPMLRQVGDTRLHEGDSALRVWQVEGDAARHPPAGVERVAFAEHDGRAVALLAEPIGDG